MFSVLVFLALIPLAILGAAMAVVALRWLMPYALAVLGLLVFWVPSQQGVAPDAAMGRKALGSRLGLIGAGWSTAGASEPLKGHQAP
jgi:hypothetical protein